MRYLIGLICLLLSLPSYSQLTEIQKEAIEEIFSPYDRTDQPGCALALVKGGEIIFEKGYGMADLERSVCISPRTVFYAGSISKQFVASCALLLSEEGKLDLDASITDFFPDFPEYGNEITVQHLIYHTSGIRDYFGILEDEGLNYLNQIPADTIYALICRQDSLDFQPGDKYSYSNSGYLMLSMIIEQVSGMTFADFARENIFDPLGMDHSLFLDDARTLVPNRALGYHRDHEGDFENMTMRFDLVGSGGLYTTVGDLAKWDNNFNEPQIGSKDFLSKLFTTGTLNDGSDTKYAFAIRVDRFQGHNVIGHSGSLGGYRAQFMRFPDEELSIIILSNLANFKPGERAHEVAKVLLNE